MKKIHRALALILGLLLLFALLTACGESNDILGTWRGVNDDHALVFAKNGTFWFVRYNSNGDVVIVEESNYSISTHYSSGEVLFASVSDSSADMRVFVNDTSRIMMNNEENRELFEFWGQGELALFQISKDRYELYTRASSSQRPPRLS